MFQEWLLCVIHIVYQLQFQNTHALNNIWRGPSSFHQSLDISLSGQPREREWAALMIGIREDKLTSDLTILTSPPSHPITHNTQWTTQNWISRECGGEKCGLFSIGSIDVPMWSICHKHSGIILRHRHNMSDTRPDLCPIHRDTLWHHNILCLRVAKLPSCCRKV